MKWTHWKRKRGPVWGKSLGAVAGGANCQESLLHLNVIGYTLLNEILSVEWAWGLIREVRGAITVTRRWTGHFCKLPDGNRKAETEVHPEVPLRVLLIVIVAIFLFLPCSNTLALNSYMWVMEL